MLANIGKVKIKQTMREFTSDTGCLKIRISIQVQQKKGIILRKMIPRGLKGTSKSFRSSFLPSIMEIRSLY
jgi:hypothetical protein